MDIIIRTRTDEIQIKSLDEIKKTAGITEVIFGEFCFDENTRAVLCMLRNCPTLSVIKFSPSNMYLMSSGSLSCLRGTMAKCPIERLCLSCNALTDNQIKIIAAVVETSMHLTWLGLSDCKINSDIASNILIHSIIANKHLEYIDISYNGLPYDTIITLIYGIAISPNIQRVVADSCGFGCRQLFADNMTILAHNKNIIAIESSLNSCEFIINNVRARGAMFAAYAEYVVGNINPQATNMIEFALLPYSSTTMEQRLTIIQEILSVH